jgi:hypothetical protein
MNNFEELRCIDRIQKLLLERNVPRERTDAQIRHTAKVMAKQNHMSYAAAFEAWEDALLNTPPDKDPYNE